MSNVQQNLVMEFKALNVPALTDEVAGRLEKALSRLPGIEQFSIGVETRELQIVFDKDELAFETLSMEMAKAGCPLRNINAALLLLRESSQKAMRRMKEKLVGDLMTAEVVTAAPDTPLPEVSRLMAAKKIRRIPIVEQGYPIGMITYGDIRALAFSDLQLGQNGFTTPEQPISATLPISEVMSCHPITITSDVTVDEASRMMLNNKISGLPVVDSLGKIVGIITESDIFRLVVTEWAKV